MRETMGSIEVILCDFCKNADVKARLTGSKLPYVWKGWAIKDGKDICPLCIDKSNKEKEEIRKKVNEAIDGLDSNFDWYNPPFDTTHFGIDNPLFKAASLKPIMNYYLIAVMVEITDVRGRVTSFFIKSTEMPTMSKIEAITTKKLNRGELKKIRILSITKFTEEEYVKFMAK